jgi:hypothetical protein
LAVVEDLREGGAATTGRLVTLRTLLVHALKIKSPVLQLDLKLAFRHLSSSSTEKALIHAGGNGDDGNEQDDGSEHSGERPTDDRDDSLVNMNMKWTPATRCQAMTTWLEAHQLTQSRCDPCLYLGSDFHVFFLHDSVLVIGGVEQFQAHILAPRFDPVPNLHHVDTVLGIQIRRSDDHGTMYLSQPKQIRKALSEMPGVADDDDDNDNDNDQPATPVTPKLHLAEASDAEHEAFLAMGVNYRQSVGLLTHIASTTRPDVAFASSYLAQFTEKPGAGHWAEVVRCWRYLRGTKEKALALSVRESSSVADLELWSDANWAGDPSSRKSHSGYLASLHGSAISWSSARQRTVSLSSTESELRALVEAVKELIWLQVLLAELNNNSNHPLIPSGRPLSHISYIDNHALACLLSSASFHSKTKHVDVHTKWLRDHVQTNVLVYRWIPTSRMLADCLTKPASRAAYTLLCSQLPLV